MNALKEKKNTYLGIWSAPRKTIQYALEKLNFWYIAFITLFGAWGTTILSRYDDANLIPSNDRIFVEEYTMPSLWSELLFSLIGAIASILVATAFMALLYWLIGKLFKGTGTFKAMYKGSMLTFLPNVIILPLIIGWLFISPETFYGVDEPATAFGNIIFALVLALVVFCFIYTMIVTIVMVSEVHQFSKWRAFFTILIPTIVMTIILIVIVIVIVTTIFVFI